MNEQLYLMAVGLSLEEKEKKAIANLRNYEHEALKRDPDNGYYVCNSYGKDSGVIMDLCKRAGVRFVGHHNLTTLDPPELVQFGRKQYLDTVVHKPDMPMLQRMAESALGPPTRLARWCCEEYKEHGGCGMVVITGVRAAESARRKDRWRVWQPNNRGGGWILNPVLYWSDADIWNYHELHKLEYCCLYDQGFDRLGCVGCPMAGDKRRNQFLRWPKIEQAWKRAFERMWQNWHGVPLNSPRWVSMVGKWPLRPIAGERFECRKGEPGFITYRRWYDLRGFGRWEDLWKWWLEELPPPSDQDGCQMGMF